MLKSSFIRDRQITIPLLLALSSSFHIVKAQQTVNSNSTTSTSASTSSCTPLNCVAKCTPNCSNEETCILRTMTNCAVCPASQCMSRTALGLPPLPTSSNNNTVSQPTSDNSSNSGLIGGLVGGLLGLGILIGIGVFCYIKRGKKKRKLPFAFTEGGVGIMSQEQFNHPPHPTLTSSFAQQNRSMASTIDLNNNTSRYNIGMSELSPTSPTSTILSTAGGQKNRSMIHPVSHISTNNNSHINNGSTLSLHDNIVNNNNNQSNNNSNSNILLPPNNKSTISSNFVENNTILASPILSNSQATVIPEEFEEKIAIQNKRISQILHNNPRISRTSYTPQIPQENRFSGISYTTDEDSEFDDDDKSVTSSAVKQAVTRSPYQPQLATQAVQVSRAKVQIMRVNSVRTNSGGNGLGRSDSVRTVLTSVPPPPVLLHLDSTESSSFADSFPSTPNNRTFPNEDPFLDTTNNIKQ